MSDGLIGGHSKKDRQDLSADTSNAAIDQRKQYFYMAREFGTARICSIAAALNLNIVYELSIWHFLCCKPHNKTGLRCVSCSMQYAVRCLALGGGQLLKRSGHAVLYPTSIRHTCNIPAGAQICPQTRTEDKGSGDSCVSSCGGAL